MRVRSSLLRGSVVKVRLRRGSAAPAKPRAPDDWHDILEWAEKQGAESLKSRFAGAELIAKEAQATLTVLLAGVGGSAAYAAKLFEPGLGSAPTWGFAITCAYLICCSIVLIMRCMRFQSYPALFQEPEHLTLRGYGLDELKEVELENLSARIREAQAINDRRAHTLNKVRVAAALTPFVFGAAALLAYPNQLKQGPAEPKTACTSTASVPHGNVVSSPCKK